MYFCYIDESGDAGVHDPSKPNKSGSRYFILAGLIIPAKNWKASLDVLKSFKKRIAHQGYLPYDVEFHCSELIDPHKIKEYTTIAVKDKWMLIEEFAETIGLHGSFNIVSVVIDKKNNHYCASRIPDRSVNKDVYRFRLIFKGQRRQWVIVI